MGRDVVERWFPWGVALLVAFPVIAFRYPPMTDLPHHEAIVGILRWMGHPEIVPPGLYEVRWGQSNQLFYALAWPLARVTSTAMACQCVVFGSVAGLVLGLARTLGHFGASRVACVFAAPLALGWLFLWGLVTNLLGLALFACFLPELVRAVTRPTTRHVSIGAAVLTLLAFAHLLLAVAAGIVVASLSVWTTLRHERSSRWRVQELVPRLVLSALAPLLVLRHILWAPPERAAAFAGIAPSQGSISEKLAELPMVLVGPHDSFERFALMAFLVVTLGGLAALGLFGRAGAVDPEQAADAERSNGARQGLLFASGALTMAFLALPISNDGATFVCHRMVAPAFLLLVVALSPAPKEVQRLTVSFLAAVPVAVLLIVWPQFADASARAAELEPLLARMSPGRAVAVLTVGPPGPGRLFSGSSLGARAVAVRGGRALSSFVTSAIMPARLRPELWWNEPDARTYFDTLAFVPAHDLKRFSYVLVQSTSRHILETIAIALAPDARVVQGEGEWLLLESTHPTVSPASPDVPLPESPPASLRARIRAVLIARGASVDEVRTLDRVPAAKPPR